MTRKLKDHTKPEPEQHHEPKMRKCLYCSEQFKSEWAGNRICPKCIQVEAFK